MKFRRPSAWCNEAGLQVLWACACSACAARSHLIRGQANENRRNNNDQTSNLRIPITSCLGGDLRYWYGGRESGHCRASDIRSQVAPVAR